MTGESARNPIQATQNSFRILERLRDADDGLSLSALDSRLELSKGAIYNHLATLQELGVVLKRNETYHLSLRTYRLAESARRSLPGTDISRKRLRELADSTGEFGALVAEEEGKPVVVDTATGELVEASWAAPGDELPLFSTAAGKIILSQKSEARIRELCEQADNEIDTQALVDEVKTVELQGLAFSRGEFHDDQYSVAAPVSRADGELIYAVTLIGPKSRLSGKSLQQDVAGLVINAVNEIERKL